MHRFRLRRDSDGLGVRARPIGDSMRNLKFMRHLKLQRPSPALIVSVLALSARVERAKQRPQLCAGQDTRGGWDTSRAPCAPEAVRSGAT